LNAKMLFPILALSIAVASAATLGDVCTTSYAQSSLPSNNVYPGITIDASSVRVTAVTNYNVTASPNYPDSAFDYCNVTFAYSHNGRRDDQVLLTYWLPAPDSFKGRYLATGGGGLAINSGSSSLAGGVMYGAASGLTDGGFGSFDTQLNSVILLANDSINWEALFMFGYGAIHEQSVIGKAFTEKFFNMSCSKLYSYYQGCSEGGREGWSQLQRFGDEWDGAVVGAPALRWAFQQVQHLYSNVVEQTLGYYPPPCELELIVNETIAACDPLDGKADGVVARSDLCKLHFNINSTIGKKYYCPASNGRSPGGPSGDGSTGSTTPAQKGTVTAKGAAVAQEILNGLHDLQGRRAYFSYQPAAAFDDAQTQYNNATNSWELSISGLGGSI
jgi:tannase